MTDRVDFSANAAIYDRRHGLWVADDTLDGLWQTARIRAGASVLDVGAGTGRVAIPLAARGCRVTAIDPAAGMLAQLRAKDGECRVHTVVAEGARLPFQGDRFAVAVVARLLYLTADWRAVLNETCRVLTPEGVLCHEWGNGQDDEEWVRIREEARRLFAQAGVARPFHPGARAEAEVDDYLTSRHLVQQGSVQGGPGPVITIREFLRRLVDGELSYVWNVPSEVREACLPRLLRWADQTFDIEQSLPMPRRTDWAIFRRAAA